MQQDDIFAGLARYYDTLMSHVDYRRWEMVASLVADMLPPSFRHLDAACGTGTLLKELRKAGWNSFGFDLSASMLRSGHSDDDRGRVFQADMRALPLQSAFDYVTCLFDSINFLLNEQDLRRAMRQFAECLNEHGLVYFDVITERMVLDHFAGQEWTEHNLRFKTHWASRYCRETHISHTDVRINQGPAYVFQERVYELHEIMEAVQSAGLQVLLALDADTWRPVRPRTVRIDVIAVKGSVSAYAHRLDALTTEVRKRLR